MTLFSLAKKNMIGNFSSYLVYFISLVFSIVIYFTFVSLQYSKKIQDSIALSDIMSFMFMASSIILILFVAIFILYSNSFFTRKRKREVGLYSMLGLQKKTIGIMLFYENLIMGLLSLVIGILLGTLLSKLFSMILIKLMGSTAEIDFSISIGAIIQTVIVFMIIILFTSIQGYRLIYRFKLIELFHAEKKGEQVPTTSLVSTIIGVILLTLSYFLILRPFPDDLNGSYIMKNYGLALVTLVIGTSLFFRSVTVYLLKLSQKNKSRYYRGTNLIETSQLLYRIKGNARTFTIIALLSAATISFFGATYSGYYGNEKSSTEDVPFSYAHLSKGQEFDTKIENIINGDKEHPITAQLDIPIIEVKGKLSFDLGYEINPIKLISVSSFNQATKALDREETIKLSRNQAAVIKPRLTEFTETDFKGKNITLDQTNQKLTFTTMVNGSVLPFDFPDFYVVVSDDMFTKLSKQLTPLTYKVYEVENEKTTEATSLKVSRLIDGDFQVHSSFYTEYKEGKEGNALNLFIFGFLGLVFLAATGSIIYFKQLTEASENKSNYEILRKVGVSKKALRKSVNKQTFFVFGLPLTVGLIHSSIILHFITNFLSNLIGASIIVPILTAMGAFVIIYIVYYVLTVNTYHKIVNK
ncbi:ABC transporter permease [Virgibacillus ndiopensis]|uniref:ABC transporter permease n=1 Tax=Virgibacillus ndiopensis TaxID=2004408 RepID=UPI000C07E358|nr:ABC transporter permease [Virgibacillus ndiopensis]